MSSASPGATHRKPTRRPGRKAPTLRPDTNTSGTAGGRVVKAYTVKGGYITECDTTHSNVLVMDRPL